MTLLNKGSRTVCGSLMRMRSAWSNRWHRCILLKPCLCNWSRARFCARPKAFRLRVVGVSIPKFQFLRMWVLEWKVPRLKLDHPFLNRHIAHDLSDFKPKYFLRSLLSTRTAARKGCNRIFTPPTKAVNPSAATFSNSSRTAPTQDCNTWPCRSLNDLVFWTEALTGSVGRYPTRPHANGSAPSKLRTDTQIGCRLLPPTPLSPPSKLMPTRAGFPPLGVCEAANASLSP